jgi:hypothetical protein
MMSSTDMTEIENVYIRESNPFKLLDKDFSVYL